MSSVNLENNKQANPIAISLQSITSNELMRLSNLERNNSFLYLFKHNWRQLTSLIPGK